jgi:hypothetical protein
MRVQNFISSIRTAEKVSAAAEYSNEHNKNKRA